MVQFEQTGLPRVKIFEEAFQNGWSGAKKRFSTRREAETYYLHHGIRVARMIWEHGRDLGSALIARVLSGEQQKTERLILSQENLAQHIVELSMDERLFLQALSIVMLECLSQQCPYDGVEPQRQFLRALEIYNAARGQEDCFHFDARFEIAAMKAKAVLNG